MTLDTTTVPAREGEAQSQLRAIWGYRWVVLAVVVLTLAATLGLAHRGSPGYTSSTEVLVYTTSTSPVDTGDPSKLLSMPTEVQIAKSSGIASAVAQQTGSDASPASLLDHLRVTNPVNTTVLHFAYDDDSADRAQQMATAFASAYLADREARTVGAVNRLTKVLTDESTALDQRRTTLDRQINAATSSTARAALVAQRGLTNNEELAVRSKLVEAQTVDTTPGVVLSQAVTPTVHSGPSTPSLVVLGLLLGLAIGIAVAWLLVGLRGPRGRSGPSDPAGAIPVLATFPSQRSHGSAPSGDASRSPGAATAVLAARFGFGDNADRSRVLMVTTARKPRAGAPAVIELASALAGGSRTVAVVEADLRHPILLSSWGIGGGSTAVKGKPWPWEPVPASGLTGVTIYPGDVVQDPRARLAGEEARTFVKDLREQFNHVLILAPPVLVSVDALELLSSVDGVIVATSDAESAADVSQASEAIELAGGTVLGAVTVVARRSFSSLFR